MTVITLTTVGYSDVHPLGAAGKPFTISLLALGAAAAIGAVTQLVAGGELGSWLRRRRMDTSLTGRAAITLSAPTEGPARPRWLSCARTGCLPGDRAQAGTRRAAREHGVPHLAADPAEEAVLRRVGVERAAGLVRAVDSDAVKVSITLTARPMNPKLTIVTRASNPESVDKLHRAGADQVVSLYHLSGSRMAVLARHPAIVSFLDMVRVAPDGGWKRPRSAKVPGWTARRTGRSAPPIPMSGSSRSPSPAPAFRLPAPGHDAWPGDLVLLLGPAGAVQDAAG